MLLPSYVNTLLKMKNDMSCNIETTVTDENCYESTAKQILASAKYQKFRNL